MLKSAIHWGGVFEKLFLFLNFIFIFNFFYFQFLFLFSIFIFFYFQLFFLFSNFILLLGRGVNCVVSTRGGNFNKGSVSNKGITLHKPINLHASYFRVSKDDLPDGGKKQMAPFLYPPQKSTFHWVA